MGWSFPGSDGLAAPRSPVQHSVFFRSNWSQPAFSAILIHRTQRILGRLATNYIAFLVIRQAYCPAPQKNTNIGPSQYFMTPIG